MRFGQFFKEVCSSLRKQEWVAPETLATTHTEILDIIFQEYTLATDEIVNAPQGDRQAQFFVEQTVRSRIETTCFQIKELKNEQSTRRS